MTGLRMNRCRGCGDVQFPPGLLCATCHVAQFETVTAAVGTTLGVTSWTSGGRELQFAEVKTDLGPTVVALILPGGTKPGQRVFFSSTQWPEARTTPGEYVEGDTED